MTSEAVHRSQVPEAFDEVADRYDLMVALNPGYHAHLRTSARVLLESLPPQTSPAGDRPVALSLVDLGCGSGASTRALVQVLDEAGRPYRLVGVDGSAGMLRAARSKQWPDAVRFVQGRAEHLAELAELADLAEVSDLADLAEMVHPREPAEVHAGAAPASGRSEGESDFDRAGAVDLQAPGTSDGSGHTGVPDGGLDGELDGILAAYLVRNVPDRDALLATLHDRLRPGGALVVHEYSVAGNRRATAVWSAVCWSVVVPLGWLTSRRTRLYRYLWRSVMEMDSTDVLMSRLRAAGFDEVRSRSVGGWQRGIIHTFHARKPLQP